MRKLRPWLLCTCNVRLGAGFFNCITLFNSHQDTVGWVSLSHLIDEETRMVRIFSAGKWPYLPDLKATTLLLQGMGHFGGWVESSGFYTLWSCSTPVAYSGLQWSHKCSGELLLLLHCSSCLQNPQKRHGFLPSFLAQLDPVIHHLNIYLRITQKLIKCSLQKLPPGLDYDSPKLVDSTTALSPF